MGKKALILDEAGEFGSAFLRRELLDMHEKYHVPLDSPAHDYQWRFWNWYYSKKKYLSFFKSKHKVASDSFDMTFEKVYYNCFFLDFAELYWSNSFLGRALRRKDSTPF